MHSPRDGQCCEIFRLSQRGSATTHKVTLPLPLPHQINHFQNADSTLHRTQIHKLLLLTLTTLKRSLHIQYRLVRIKPPICPQTDIGESSHFWGDHRSPGCIKEIDKLRIKICMIFIALLTNEICKFSFKRSL